MQYSISCDRAIHVSFHVIECAKYSGRLFPNRFRCFTDQVAGAWSGSRGSVIWIEETATFERETTAPNAPGQFIAQRFKSSDTAIQRTVPRLRQPLPILSVRGPRLRKLVKRLPYLLQGEPENLSGADHRNSPESLAGIQALATSRSLRRYQTALLVVAQRRCPDPASRRRLANR